MRLSEPRITPVDLDTASPEQRELLEPFADTMGMLNIFRTLARTPKGFKRFNVWGSYILGRGTSLSAREREIAILRTGWKCRSGYEWVQHTRIGKEAGLTDSEIEAIKVGASSSCWSQSEAAILRAVDDLVEDFFVTDATWEALDVFSEQQKMDLVYTVGQYTLVSMMLNSFGIQLDSGQSLDADFPK